MWSSAWCFSPQLMHLASCGCRSPLEVAGIRGVCLGFLQQQDAKWWWYSTEWGSLQIGHSLPLRGQTHTFDRCPYLRQQLHCGTPTCLVASDKLALAVCCKKQSNEQLWSILQQDVFNSNATCACTRRASFISFTRPYVPLALRRVSILWSALKTHIHVAFWKCCTFPQL